MKASPTSALRYWSKQCKSFGYTGCKRDKSGCEEVDVFRKGKFKLFVLIAIKLKGVREISWFGVNGIIVRVQETETVWEGVTVLMNDVIHFGCVNSRTLCVKFRFLRVKECVV